MHSTHPVQHPCLSDADWGLSSDAVPALRPQVNLTLDQTDLVARIAAANPRTVVVAISPGPFLTPFRDSVAAILDFGMPGEQVRWLPVTVL